MRKRREDYVDDTRNYHLFYVYHLGGNRLKKIDAVNDREVVYHYDIDDPGTYFSANNRLEYYEEFDTSGGGQTLLATTYYYYTCSGNPDVVLTHDTVADTYSAVRLQYALNGSTVTHVLGETWTYTDDPLSTCPDRTVNFAREFRYDGARGRYLDRELDPAYAQIGSLVALSDLWTDYDGDHPHGDFTFDGTLTNVRSFELGIARAAWSNGLPKPADYYHTNHLGTTRLLTDPNALQIEPGVFTAFGEPLTAQADRYGYVGAWGYEGLDPVSFYHVGMRYYDPSAGRFLQRDPIGIRGGLNVYAYVRNGPTIRIDPDGRAQFDVGACVGYCSGKLGGCIGAAGGKPGRIAKCEAKYKACETCCGNADAESEMGDDKGPPPYGPPPATFDPWPAGGSHWRPIAVLLLCFLSLWVKRVQPVPRVSK